MKAVGYAKPGPITAADSLMDFTPPEPAPGPRDLLVRIEAVSVNPVDTKVRTAVPPPAGQMRILGWDAAGIVEAIGNEVTAFKPGDAVWYAGELNRPGTNSEWHVVDERLVGRKPQSLSFTEAAAMPLTGLTVIATASRPETIAWVERMGAHHVIDHRHPLDEGLRAIGIPEVRYVAALSATDHHLPAIVRAMTPQGKLAVIDDPPALDIAPLKEKSLSVHWELMFTRSSHHAPDMIVQQNWLNEVADLVDAGVLRTTLNRAEGRINAANLRNVHALVESGRSIGKIVLAGF